jgi:ubiquinone biosynthesis protein UbiJ
VATLDMNHVLGKIAASVAVAAVLGGGTMVLHTAQDTAVQRAELTEQGRRITAVEHLADKLEETNNNVIILNERLRTLDVGAPRPSDEPIRKQPR